MFNFNNFKKAAVIASLGLALTACGDKDNKETASKLHKQHRNADARFGGNGHGSH